MKIKSLIGFILVCCVLFSSCDDDLRSVGGNIQPGGDDVSLEIDSLNVGAKTVLMDKIYARTTSGLLGRYDDDIYGAVLSEYMCEFFCDTLAFKDDFFQVDSTKIGIRFLYYTGDSVAPMGLSFYGLNDKLDKNYYTDIDPSKYCDMSKPLASTSYSIVNTPYYSTSSKVRVIEADMGDWGQKLYEASKTSNNPLANSKAFLDYFPGVYVKSSFGNGSLVDVIDTYIGVYYRTKKDTVVIDKTTKLEKDSVMYTKRSLFLPATSEVIQLNKIQNTVPSNLLTPNTGAVYIKSPAGTSVEMELPIEEIISKMTLAGAEGKTVNLARLKLKGYTELEQQGQFNFGRTSTLLLINKDSVQSFFENPYRIADLSSSLIYTATRDASTNTYTFNNLAPMIKKYKEQGITENPKFMLIPITVSSVTISNSTTIIGYFNSMKPALSVLRAKEGDIKLEMIYSTF